MKQVLKKSTAIIVIIFMLLNSSFLNLISVAIDEIGNAIEKSKVKSVYEMALEKYVNYDLAGKKGVLVQVDFKSGIEYQDEYSPLKANGTLLKMPKIGEEYPESVQVLAISTKATNGEEQAKDFDYAYDSQKGELKFVAVNNEDKDGNIYKEKVEGARDEYKIIANYSENAYSESKEERELDFEGSVQQTIADINETKNIEKIQEKYVVSENVSNLISTNIEVDNIYNGYIYANNNNETNYDTEYSEKYNIDISLKDNVDKYSINSKTTFVKNNEKIDSNEILFKKTKVNKKDILDKLGDNGVFKITNLNGDVLLEVNKDTQTDENGNIEIEYSEELSEINITFTKPINIGTITLENTKAIKSTMKDLNVKSINVTDKIEGTNHNTEVNEENQEVINESDEKVYESTNENNTEIKDSETKIDLYTDTVEYTNNTQNEVNFVAKLVTNDSKYNLFKNPSIEIKLPEEIEKVVLGNVSVLYDDKLILNNAEVVDDGQNKYIKVELKGQENEYNINSMVDGGIVLIPATIIVKKDIQNVDTDILYTYSNETGIQNDYINEGKENKNIGISISSIYNQDSTENTKEQKLMIKKLNVSNQNLATISSDDIDLSLEAYVGDHKLEDGEDVNIGDINNSDEGEIIQNQVIKYCIKVKNNTNQDINNLDIRGLVPAGTNYVSDIDMATYWGGDNKYILDNTTTEVNTNITSIKSGETKEFFYEVIVDALDENTNEKEILNTVTIKQNDQEIKNASIKNIAKKGKISVFIKTYYSRDRYSNGFLFYIYVKNNTNSDINNIHIETSEFQKELKYLSYIDFGATKSKTKFENNKVLIDYDTLSANTTECVRLETVGINFDEKNNEVVLKLCANAKIENDNDEIYYSNEARRNAYPEIVTIKQELAQEGERVPYGTELEYKFTIKNESKVRATVNLKELLPEGLNPETATYEVYNNEEDKNGDTLARAIEYNFDYENGDNFIKEEKAEDISETVLDKDGNRVNNLEYITLIPAQKEVKLIVKAKTGNVDVPTVVSNYATITGCNYQQDYPNGTSTKTSNVVSVTLLPDGWTDEPEEPDEPDNPDKPSNPENPDQPVNPEPTVEEKTYSISGKTWYDKNRDGIYSNESLLSGITVNLYNAETSVIATDKNGKVLSTKTDNNGKYEFTNVKKGKYFVVFNFDTNKYVVTKYNVSSNDKSNVSLALSKEVSIDGGKSILVGMTDELNVTENITNINLGLSDIPVNDVKIEKYISKITVTNNKGTKEYEFNNKNLAKVEVYRKQINNTTINVEYKIVITNEGNVDNYITNIIDYLPEGLTVEDSTNWSSIKNNAVENKSLAGTILKAGESRTITLNATKKLSDGKLGNLVNVAKIDGIKNTDNISDNNSDNNSSEATLIVTVSTGAKRNIAIFITVLILAILIFVLIKNKKINIKNIKNSFKILILLTILFTVGALNINTIASSNYSDGELLDSKDDWDNIVGTQSEIIEIHEKSDYNGTQYHQFIGSDGKLYSCITHGLSQCKNEGHYYEKSWGSADTGWTYKKAETLKDVTLSVSSANAKIEQTNNKSKVGPYNLTTNYDGKFKITGTYKYVNSDGNTISTGHINKTLTGGTQSFTLELEPGTISVSDLHVKLTVENAKKKIYRREAQYTFECIGVTCNDSAGYQLAANPGPGYYGYGYGHR